MEYSTGVEMSFPRLGYKKLQLLSPLHALLPFLALMSPAVTGGSMLGGAL